MVLMAGYDLPMRAIRQQVASALDLIVHLERLEDGWRRVTAITEVQRMESDVITLQDIFEFKIEEITSERDVVGQLRPTGSTADLPLQVREARHQPPGRPLHGRQAESGSGGNGQDRVSLRRLSIVFVAAAALTALSVQAAGAQEASGLHLRPTGGTAFPDRAYVLSLPSEAYLPPGAVVVRENGKIVKGVTVVPASTAQSGQFGVVLVIDASNSMRGDAIAGATAAARAFADNRQPGQSFAIVTFNKKTNVALPLTTDSEAIDAVLAAPPTLAHDTHLYDAVGQAVSMLEDGNVTVRSVVVLSDGADTGSGQSLEEVSSAAQAAGVRVFTVGLRSGAFDPTALQDLARQAGGQYSARPSSTSRTTAAAR